MDKGAAKAEGGTPAPRGVHNQRITKCFYYYTIFQTMKPKYPGP